MSVCNSAQRRMVVINEKKEWSRPELTTHGDVTHLTSQSQGGGQEPAQNAGKGQGATDGINFHYVGGPQALSTSSGGAPIISLNGFQP